MNNFIRQINNQHDDVRTIDQKKYVVSISGDNNGAGIHRLRHMHINVMYIV